MRFVPRIYDPENNRLEFDYTWDVFGFRSATSRRGLSNFRATQLTRLAINGKDGWAASNAGIFSSSRTHSAKSHPVSQTDSPTPRKFWYGPGAFHGAAQPERNNWVSYTLQFPVILISCPLYVIDASTEAPVLEHAHWVRLQRHLVSDTVKGLFEFDVVTRDHFDEYIVTVVEGIAEEIAANGQAGPTAILGVKIGGPQVYRRWVGPDPGTYLKISASISEPQSAQ